MFQVFGQGSSQQNGGDLERLMDGQTKLWASMDQVRASARQVGAGAQALHMYCTRQTSH